MRCKVVVNACAPAFPDRAAEIATFLENHQQVINHSFENTEALIFHPEEILPVKVLEELPFQNTRLIKIKHYQPEAILAVLVEIEKDNPADMYLFTADLAGSELAVRFAGRMNGSSLVAVEKLSRQNEGLVGIKKVYSGNLEGTFLFCRKPYCIALARGLDKTPTKRPETTGSIINQDYSSIEGNPKLVSYHETLFENEQTLERAPFIIAAGRGAGSQAEIKRLEDIAFKIGAELGVSRPVVMNAWAPLSRLLGASGKVVAPEICLVIGASGSPPFYYGIEKSKLIIAVNTDEHAPIMKAADVIIVADYREIINALKTLITFK
jgi:electron transfer flavoprotein alpha subunit